MRRLLRRSVRGKLLAVVLATTLLASLVNALALLVYNVRDYRTSQLADARTQALILGRASAAALAAGDTRQAEQELQLLQARPDVEAAALYGADGKLFASYARSAGSALPPLAAAPAASIAGDRLTVFHRISQGNETLGTVYLQTRYGLRERTLAYLAIVGVVIVAALAAALALSSWLHRAVTDPILKVAGAARAVVERRDYSARAEKSTEDEIGMLADAFNSMLREVQARSEALVASNESLQREMLERVEAEEALRRADRRKDEFLATLAHELRNPLAPIRNALYLLRAAGADVEAAANARAVIERQLQQMVRLVDDLLDVSRISTGKLALRRERVELRSVAQNAIEAVEPLFHARGHALNVSLPPPGAYVNADPTRLAQVFLNLLNNAAKFTDPGGRIDFSVGLQADELVARVRDNGIGIAPEMRQAIFEMFAQADRSLERSVMGLGVGLSLARKLVELHGGTIEVQSEGIGRGSEFVVRIPIATPQPARGLRRRILLADDNRDFALSLAHILRRMGNDVRVEHDGAAARAAAEEFKPDYAFLDIGLPKLNGFDLARELRRAHSPAVLVAVTGWGQSADRERASDAGFDHYLVKPIEMETLQDLLVK